MGENKVEKKTADVSEGAKTSETTKKSGVISGNDNQEVHAKAFKESHKNDKGPSQITLPAVKGEHFRIEGDLGAADTGSKKAPQKQGNADRHHQMGVEELAELSSTDPFAKKFLSELREAKTDEERKAVQKNIDLFYGSGTKGGAQTSKSIVDTGVLKAINEDTTLPADTRAMAEMYQQMRKSAKDIGFDTRTIDEGAQLDLANELKQARSQPQESSSLSHQMEKPKLEGHVVLPDQFECIPEPVKWGFEQLVNVVRDVDKGVVNIGTGNWKEETGKVIADVMKITEGDAGGKLNGQARQYLILACTSVVKMIQSVDHAKDGLTPESVETGIEKTKNSLFQHFSDAYQYFEKKYVSNEMLSVPQEFFEATKNRVDIEWGKMWNFPGKVVHEANEFPAKDIRDQSNTIGMASSVVFLIVATKKLLTPSELAGEFGVETVEIEGLSDKELAERGIKRTKVEVRKVPELGELAPEVLELIAKDPSKFVKDRISELASQMKKYNEDSQGRVVLSVSVAEDAAGKRMVLLATSEEAGYLRKGVLRKAGEILLKGTGHAEEDIAAYAKASGLKLIDIGATWSVCAHCQAILAKTAVHISTPLRGKP